MAEKEGRVNIIITAKDATKGALSSATKGFQGLGKMAVLGAGAAVTAAGVATVGVLAKSASAFVEFEDQMNEVFTLLPGISGEAMGQMRDQVKDAAVEMGRLPEEIIPALYQSLSAGVPQDNVFEFLDTAHQAALGGVTDLETAVDGISSVVNAYGSDVMDATQASDLMFTAVRLGKTDFGQLSQNLSAVTPLASAMGVKFEDVTAALAAMTAQGTPTNQATTQMRALLTELGDAGTEVGKIFQDVAGESFLEFIDGGGSVADVLMMLEEEALATNTPLQDMFSSVRSGMAALQLTGGGMETFQANLAEMQDSAGATEAAYDTMNSGMARSFEVMQATVQTIMLDIGEAIAPVVSWLSEKLLQAFDDLSPYIDAVTDTLERFFKGLEDGEGIASALAQAWENVAEGFGVSRETINEVWQLINSLGEAFNIIKWGVLGDEILDWNDAGNMAPEWLREVTYAVLDLWFAIKDFITPIIEWVKNFVSAKDVMIALGLAIASFILPIIGSLVASIISILAPIIAVIAIIAILRNAWENDWGGIRTKLTEAWENTIRPALEQLIEWLQINIPIAIAALRDWWENVLLPAIQRVWEFISQVLIPILIEIATNVFETVKAAIQGLSEFWTNTLLPAIQDVWAFIQNDLIPLFNAVVEFINAAFTLALTALQGLWQNVLLPALEAVWGFIQENLLPIIVSLVETGILVLEAAVAGLEILWTTIFKPALEAVWAFIQDNLLPILQDLIEKILDKLKPALDTIKGVFDTLKGAINNVSGAVQGVIGWIQSMIEKIQSVELPWWLTPGSPTPFETGLVGIAKATAEATRELGKMESQLMTRTVNFGFNSSFSGLPTGQYSGVGRPFQSSQTTSNEFHLHVTTSGDPREIISQFELMQAMVIE